VTRARIAGQWRKPVAELEPIIAAAAGALGDATPDLIVYHCTDSSMREGLDGERRILDIVRRAAGIEAVSNNINMLAEPRVRTGHLTMFYMATSLAFTAGGIILPNILIHADDTPASRKLAVAAIGCAADLLQAIPGMPWGLRFVILALPWIAMSAVGGSMLALVSDILPDGSYIEPDSVMTPGIFVHRIVQADPDRKPIEKHTVRQPAGQPAQEA